MLNTTLFNIVCFVSYSLFSTILAHTMPKDMFLTWILFTLIWTIFSYLVWSANRQDTKGWILSTILLAILFSTCFTYTDNTISSTTILNFLLYVFLVVVLYKGTKETLIIVILSIISGVTSPRCTIPGDIQFTFIPPFPNSIAKDLV